MSTNFCFYHYYSHCWDTIPRRRISVSVAGDRGSPREFALWSSWSQTQGSSDVISFIIFAKPIDPHNLWFSTLVCMYFDIMVLVWHHFCVIIGYVVMPTNFLLISQLCSWINSFAILFCKGCSHLHYGLSVWSLVACMSFIPVCLLTLNGGLGDLCNQVISFIFKCGDYVPCLEWYWHTRIFLIDTVCWQIISLLMTYLNSYWWKNELKIYMKFSSFGKMTQLLTTKNTRNFLKFS